jgi:hypothetical protein
MPLKIPEVFLKVLKIHVKGRGKEDIQILTYSKDLQVEAELHLFSLQRGKNRTVIVIPKKVGHFYKDIS